MNSDYAGILLLQYYEYWTKRWKNFIANHWWYYFNSLLWVRTIFSLGTFLPHSPAPGDSETGSNRFTWLTVIDLFTVLRLFTFGDLRHQLRHFSCTFHVQTSIKQDVSMRLNEKWRINPILVTPIHTRSGQVWGYTPEQRVAAWPSPRQTPGPSYPYPSDRPPSGHRPGRRQAPHILR